ncbi:tetratricopeptide-like helical domain-containing protein (TPR) [Tieghemostelium lacteum]|uniref:Tetratricopeptide-like helical domain-containing protein (TPR) n=1 Tax=Tieghemostelium lacteum TaxID=361077 RepID=A0A151ZI69_TIELA|nr:tetratricopeptide-like helical domain-containing protein (TPR) [Tieghemostelium lacteum]|eukprot:KYQ93570.1 tetratricopeptide-like helical domain-containing protein (TPR) [Tieghemostelium lacteum]
MAPTVKSELSTKDQGTLKTISKLFDDKKYKKGLKLVETFLKTHPENVDGLCFKSLIVYNMSKKDEAHDIAKKVLRSNLSNSMAWHTLGFLHKSDKNYSEALKCFRNASKHAKDNTQILKDLLSVQLYLRDSAGLRESYSALLHAQPAQKGNWVGLILAYHLQGNYKQALVVLDKFNEVLDDKEKSGVSYSELILYKCMVIEESGDLDQVMQILKNDEKLILDKMWSKKKQAEILMKQKQPEKAEKIYRDLIKVNPDDYNIHRKLIECKLGVTLLGNDMESLSVEQVAIVDKLYQDLKVSYPKSLLIQRLPLNYLKNAEQFRSELFNYVKVFLRKGIPSLFNSLKLLYKNPEKIAIIESLLNTEMESLKKSLTFSDASTTTTEKEQPSTYLWSLYFMSQHYDQIGQHQKSLDFINQAISHTPTCVDLYIQKAKVYKHQGDHKQAYQEYNYARTLDLADRYLNTKAAKYALRNNDPLTADQIVSLIKDDRTPLVDQISEFQCMWYEQELGDAYQRCGNYGRSLKNYYLVDRHFNEFLEDQFDFHHHIQKKLTLRSYIEFLRWEDNVFQNKPYTKAMKQLIRVYSKLINQQHQQNFHLLHSNQLKNAEELENTLKQRRELQEKLRNESKATSEGQPIILDEDPNGEKLLQDSNLLTTAMKYLKTLLKFNNDSIDTHVLACEFYLIKKKYLAVLKSLLKIKQLVEAEGQQLSQSNVYHRYLIKLFHQYDSEYSTLGAPVKEVVDQEKTNLLSGKSLVDYNNEFLKQNPNTIAHQFAGTQMSLLLNPEQKEQLSTKFLEISNAEGTYKDALEVYQFLSNIYGNEIAEKYRVAANQKYPLANIFQI